MAKHEAWELQQMQSLPLSAKIRMSQNRIRGWYDNFQGCVYVARSGGKDSDVLGHLVKDMYPDVPQVFVNTGLEFDSVRKHGIEVADVVLQPEMSFVEVITKYGYPIISKEVAGTISGARNSLKKGVYSHRLCKLGVKEEEYGGLEHNSDFDYEANLEKSLFNQKKWKFLLDAPFRISNKCCDIMKKNPTKKYEKKTGNKPFIGTMATESLSRKTKWMQHGCNAFEEKRPTSQPLSFWTEQDILQYILQKSIEVAKAYGIVGYEDSDGMVYNNLLFGKDLKLVTTGEKRTGCVFCMFGITQDTERFLRLKEIEPKKYDYVMRGGKFDDEGMWIPHNGLGYKFVIDWLNEHGNMDIKY